MAGSPGGPRGHQRGRVRERQPGSLGSARPAFVHVFVVTNDFPPRFGGINDYVDRLVRRLPAHEVTVFTSSYAGAAAFDLAYPREVIRLPTEMMLPVPGVKRELDGLLRARRPDLVLFGAAWPLGHLGPGILATHDLPYGGFTHGLELTGAILPGVLRHIGRHASLLTAVSAWARGKLEPAFGWRGRMPLLPSGIDTGHFHPGVSDAAVRERHALGTAPVACCVSRLVARKGQDMLIRAWPAVRRAIPGAKLLIVGQGPDDATLRALARAEGVAADVVFTGAVPYAELPAYFRAGDVFAMPCRSRWFGFDIEALGAVFLQGAAVGRAVIAGASGGAPEAVRHGETGLVVDPDRPGPVGEAVIDLLGDPDRRERMGAAGAAWVHAEWTWDAMAARLDGLIRHAVIRDS
ncbi:MAG: glycosyltransferase family 4 protein [Cytophagaceae bacterium]|nr:glycosyltransferase family 4 protein [Gemmatimonadaceae bacterium]